MIVKLNGSGYEHAKRLIEEGTFTDDERDAWSDHYPSTQIEKDFIEKKGLSKYSKWFLAAKTSTGKKVGGITNFHMAISKMFIAAAFSLHKARLARTNTSISKMRRQIYSL
jgi:hypothetical protein